MTFEPKITAGLLEPLRREGLDTLEGAFAFDAGDDLSKPGLNGRRRTRLTLTDDEGREHELYLKRYPPEPPTRRLRRLWTHGRVMTPAAAEVRNIRGVLAAGISTMRAIAWGEQPATLAGGRSYLVVTAVPGDALERTGADWLRRCRRTGREDLIDELTRRLAELARRLHAAGLVHRDLYASHVFMHETESGPELYLIDLARVFTPRIRSFRWRVKDLAQIRYSMPAEWVESHWDEFLSAYLGDSVRRPDRWRRAIERKVRGMQRQAERRRRRSER